MVKNFLRRRYRTLKNKLNDFFKYGNKYKKNSFSQCGEDLLIQYIFSFRGINKPSYIDIGAHHPFYLSNTAIFYNKGSRGINIEANPQQHLLFKKYRPQDINLNIGISDKECEMDFYIMEDTTLNTFSKEEYEKLLMHKNKLIEIKRIKLINIETVLKQYYKGKCPDFLNIDVEGMDFKILLSINFDVFTPKVICVEAAEYSPIATGARKNEIIHFLISKGYFEYANTSLNAIMVKKDFWFI